MQNVKLTIESNIQVGKDIFLMKLVGDCTAIKNPGEFIEITIPGYYLRRPISVNDFSNNHVDILYKVLGHAKEFNKLGIKPTLVYGARSKDDIVQVEELEQIAKVIICTDDGSLGFKGNVIECIKNSNIDFDYYYACGPYPMLKFLSLAYPNGCVSLEARMGCGFGACMGCSVETINGPKRVCKEGPVFEASEVKF